jgi:hypothetical protein
MHARRQATVDSSYRVIRFLWRDEFMALLRSVPDDDIGRVERRVYLTAMPGMRKLDQYMKTRHRGDDDLVFPAGKPIYRSKPLSASRPRSGRARAEVRFHDPAPHVRHAHGHPSGLDARCRRMLGFCSPGSDRTLD